MSHRIALSVILLLVSFCSAANAAKSSGISLRWQDNSDNEDGFCIERSKDGKEFQEIARVGRDTTVYTDLRLLKGYKKYYYRIRAYNQFGYSGYTNVSLGTIPEIEEVAKSVTGFLGTVVNHVASAASDTFYQLESATNKQLVQIDTQARGFGSTEDELDFAYLTADGDCSIIVRLSSLDTRSNAAQAGLMVRQSHSPQSARAAITLTRKRDIELNWRTHDGGSDLSQSIPAPSNTEYLAAFKMGPFLALAYSSDGRRWSFAKFSYFPLSGEFLVGMAASSGSPKTSSTARFEIVSMQNLELQKTTAPADETELPSKMIGSPKHPGFYEVDATSGFHSLAASGNGIDTGAQDEIRYSYFPCQGDSHLVLRVLDLQAASKNSQIGFMYRDSLDAGSKFAAISLDGQSRASALWRSQTGKRSYQRSLAQHKPSQEIFLKLSKQGNNCYFSTSADGFKWSSPSKVSIDLGNEYLAGIYLGSASSQLSTATVEIVESSEPLLAPSRSYYRDTRQHASIGLRDSQTKSEFEDDVQLFKLESQGKGFEYYEDELGFTYWNGLEDYRIAVKVHSFNPDGNYARVGIGVRTSLAPDSASAAIAINGYGQVSTLTRSKDGSKLQVDHGPKLPSGSFLAIERRGDTLEFFWSTDGVQWNDFGTEKLKAKGTHHFGLMIGSQNGKSSALLELTGLY
ncbi:hypothetical protein [Pelagicoccus sp. SDUM812005]|uniref:hypothetical protein n=1 Tax=Pelagicoccus sp. SDUM812005 TaxID=3041257 RepID=UPI00280F42CC|nr:hypothetical protein [Pelagicoccus sp. SDUM812005]MDQ8183540.1 hypothetical protein [Pelagicoccus sp. SDUM812005]